MEMKETKKLIHQTEEGLRWRLCLVFSIWRYLSEWTGSIIGERFRLGLSSHLRINASPCKCWWHVGGQ